MSPSDKSAREPSPRFALRAWSLGAGLALALAANAETLVVGSTDSSGYPITFGALDGVFAGASEGVVTRMATDLGSLVFSVLNLAVSAAFGI